MAQSESIMAAILHAWLLQHYTSWLHLKGKLLILGFKEQVCDPLHQTPITIQA